MAFWASWAWRLVRWCGGAVKEHFTLDGRSLAVLRIGLALLILADLANRLPDLTVLYSDAGVLPVAALSATGRVSVHLWHGDVWFQGALFLVAALFAVALMIGWQTQTASVASWFMLLSLHARNPLIQNGGDTLFRMLLFWGMFVPLGSCWSLDRWLRRDPPRLRVCCLGTAALVLQVCMMYWFSVAFKRDSAWHADGTAIYYALSLDSLATPWGQYLLGFPQLLSWLTFTTYWLEILAPAMLFIPFWRGGFRLAAVAAMVGFHLFGLGLSMELILFPYVCALAWLAFLPAGFWDWLAAQRWLTPRWGRLDDHRQRMGLLAQRWLVGQPAVTTSLMNVLAASIFLYVLVWNVRSMSTKLSAVMPAQMNRLGNALGLEQKWNMFAPKPTVNDGWFVVMGRLEDGTELNLLNRGVPTAWEADPVARYAPVDWDKPALISATFKSHRWRKYLCALSTKEMARYRPYYGEYLQRSWGQHYQDQPPLQRLEFYWVVEKTLPDFQVAPPRRWLMFAQDAKAAILPNALKPPALLSR